MKRKYSSMAVIFLSTAVTLHLTDQAARHVQESSLLVKPAAQIACPGLAQADLSAYLPSGGLGAMVEAEPRGGRLVSLMPGHAAEKAGLELGDRIVSIDGVSARGQDTTWLVSHLRGKIGTTVSLEVERGDGIWQRSFVLNLERQSIDSGHSVYSRVRDGELTLKVLWIDGSTVGQLSEHLAQATRGDVRSVVLDLQNVSYGSVSDMADCASLFVPQGSNLGRVVNSYGTVKAVSSDIVTTGHPMTDQLTAIEVGPYTARAGEMLAKGLAENVNVEVRGSQSAGLGILDGRTIRSRESRSIDRVELLDSQGRSLEGRPLKPDFWTVSNLMGSIPSGLEQ